MMCVLSDKEHLPKMTHDGSVRKTFSLASSTTKFCRLGVVGMRWREGMADKKKGIRKGMIRRRRSRVRKGEKVCE